MTSTGEAGGYYGRAWASDEPQNFKAFVLQSLLILSAPPFLAASVYMAFGRITRALDTEGHFRRTGLVTKFYVILDVLIFFSQIGGAGIQITGDPDVMRAGRIAIVAGLAFQLVAFVVFVWLVARVHRWAQSTSGERPAGLYWRRYFWALYAVSVAVFLRGLIRLIEYAEGVGGVIAKKEVYLYIFDAGLMFLVLGVLVCCHPGFLLRRLRLNKTKEYDGLLP